jgi:putative aldouronate transport system permease protein
MEIIDPYKKIMLATDTGRNTRWIRFKNQLALHMMVWPGILFMFIFVYIPLAGYILAFQDYQITSSIFHCPWVGLKHFQALFQDSDFFLAVRNTFALGGLKFIAGFILPLFFALVLNEIPFLRLKKITQTGSYLPHFLSYVVIATIWMVFLDSKGMVNDILLRTGLLKKPIMFLAESKLFWGLGTIIEAWKETGWNAIIYLAAIAGVDPELYEAAVVDGAGRLKRIIHITLPAIAGTMIVLFIFNFGNMLSGGQTGSTASNFDQSYLLGNPFNHETSYVIQYYILDNGLKLFRYSYSTAASLLLAITSLLMMLLANWSAKKATGRNVL